MQGVEAELVGEVSYGGRAYPVHVRGSFGQSGLGRAGDKVAAARDLTGQFDVLHLAVRTEPAPEALQVASAVSGPVFVLYLLRRGTREVTLIETPAGSLANPGLRRLLRSQADAAHFASDSWAHKLFQPVAAGEGLAAQFAEGQDAHTYAETYWQTPDCWVRYNIRFTAFSNGPSDIGAGAGEFNHQLRNDRKWTDSNCPYYAREDSPFVLGTYSDPVQVLLRAWGDGSISGDVFLKGFYDGDFWTRKGYSASVALSLGLSVFKVLRLSSSLTLCCAQSTSQSRWVIYSQGDNWTKRVSMIYADRYLPQAGDHFSAVVQVAWGEGAYGLRETQAEWTVPVYADWDDWSTTLYHRTTSQLRVSAWYLSGR